MSKPWVCYNRSCGAQLGVITRGELSISPANENVEIINTDGALLHVACGACGRVNRWIPKDSDLVRAVMGTHFMRSLVRELMMAQRHFGDPSSLEEDNNG